MYDEPLKRCLIKLVQNLRDNQINNRKKITLFLGAGCSLGSSPKDISTYGIIKDIVKRYSCEDDTLPEEWTELYKRFTNNVWKGQGNTDKINLLEGYFKDMEPSMGYHHVRFLIENNYINNIITTNFDPMLDEVLKGLSYHLQIGTNKQTIGDNPQFTLLKAHGDLNKGQLRFSPDELYKLPSEIETVIHTLTDGIVIIVGYRGQDTGIIQALNETENHCAYWITYDKPDSYNEYENAAVINWLKKRGSENNLLYGTEYGDFDTILGKIADMLSYKNEMKESRFYSLWEKSYINDFLSLNLRFRKILNKILEILEDIVKPYSWKPCSPYYAESHDEFVEAAIGLLTEKIIPAETLYCIANEVDSLLFAVSTEIWCLCQGYPVIHTTLIHQLYDKYNADSSNPNINKNFWDAVKWLSGLNMTTIPTYPLSYCEITISLDEERDFQMILKKVSLLEFSSLLLTLQRLLLFVKTSGKKTDIVGMNRKQTLEQYLYQILAHERKIDIRLNAMPESLYQEIYQGILKNYFSEKILVNRHILYFENSLIVQVDVEAEKETAVLSIMDELCAVSIKMIKRFMDETDSSSLLKRESFEIFQKFLNSESNGLFMVGESGIGKTCMLKKLVADMDSSRYIILPVASKQIEFKQSFIRDTFVEELGAENQLEFINIMLGQRQQKLLFIIDAINEMNVPLQQVISVYKEVLGFCDFLSQKDLKNIQLIITCRTDFYFQIQHCVSLEPSPSSFFSTVDNDGKAATIYRVPYFQSKDVEAIINSYSLNHTLSQNILLEKFGDIIYVPLYLDMICKMNSKRAIAESVPSEFTLYQMWFENLLNTAKNEFISIECINKLLSYIIFYNYFSDFQNALTTSRLFIGISDMNEYASQTYEWITAHNVLKKTFPSHNIVLFAHDKIEEFFLTQYMHDKYGWDFNKMMSEIKTEQQESLIVQNSIRILLQILQTENMDLFTSNAVSVINQNNRYIISVFIELLLESPSDLGVDLDIFLKDIEQFICKSVFENFINLIYYKINEKIENYQFFPIQSMEFMDRYMNTSNVGTSPLLMALNYYNYAKYIWTFPVERDDRAYPFAIQMCKRFRKLDKNLLPARLIDKNNRLLAVLLRNDGKLREAVELMEKVYQNLYKNVCFDEACLALLELGAMYREFTWFDKALKLYQDYNVNLLTDITLKYRLYMNTGIIYKNKAQNALFSKCVTNETYDNYDKAQKLFSEVYEYAKKVNHIPLQLEIIAELIECTVAGYYLNLTTIADAVKYAKEMDDILPKYPVPVRKIQRFRMWARVFTLQGKLIEAIEYLRKGFDIAVHYNIPFRAADCCNQISGILCENLNSNLITQDLINEGIQACQYSIDYYQQLQQSEHVYLNDARQKLKKLQNASENIF